MNRRQAIQRVAMIIGGSVIGANLFLEGCTRSASKDVETLFEQSNVDLLNELADAILPRTSTPGAKDANVGAFIPVMIRDCYTSVDQKAFVEGLSTVDEVAQKEFNKKFAELTPEERLQFVNRLDKQAKDFQKEKKEKEKAREQDRANQNESSTNRQNQNANKVNDLDEFPNHFFTMLKQLTLTGFFTSEVGMTQALRYVKIPGKFDGAYPYKKGDRAFA
ncbi:gluconate 2-dehydrogenase subunit 3 family protein [Sphingobacterium pedocola]|uniref:Twin-arginine translocation pathway signal protein n=1 Tax=Sphingobacterium pedocola TaxID=2082722 RepID=A0ABR9T583_9SPHI|nr:gluconate 2-dehydrogenase subunit 3 family protein [Sphingobacterium pedocola]MBE8720445.1 twin-arginine translocation pathway signal protein [Sphingobacterium pedocola]